MAEKFSSQRGAGIAVWMILTGLLCGCGSKSGVLSEPGRGVSRSYFYTLKISAFLAPPETTPVRIEVQNGQAVSVVPLDRSITIDRAFFAHYDTIPKLQQVIDDARKNNAYRVDATYDTETGVPTTAYIDPSASIADDELGFIVTDYTPL